MKNFILQNKTTLILITVGLVLICAGIVTKQPSSVMAKAVKICLECVGIG